MVWRASRPLTATLAAMTLATALVPPATAWAGKRIVDAVVAKHPHETLTWVVVEFVLVAGQALMQRGLSLTSQILGLRLGIDVNVAILERAVGLDLLAFEDSEFYDGMTRARREASTRPVQLVRESFGLVQNLVTLAGYAALLVRFSPWVILVLLVATIPATAAEMHAAKLTFQMRNRRSQEWRRLTYLEHVLANDEHAKEVKLFELGPPLLDRYRGLSAQLFADDRRVAIRRSIGQTLSLLATVAFYGAYVVMALAAAAGRITLGNLTLYVVAFRQGQQAFQSVLASIGSIYEQNLYMSNLFEFLDAPRGTTGDAGPAGAASAPPEDAAGFAGTRFRARLVSIPRKGGGRRRGRIGRRVGSARRLAHDSGGDEPRARRRERRRQDDAREAGDPPLRADGRADPPRRARPPRVARGAPAGALRRRLPGLQSVPAHGPRQRRPGEHRAPRRRRANRARGRARAAPPR